MRAHSARSEAESGCAGSAGCTDFFVTRGGGLATVSVGGTASPGFVPSVASAGGVSTAVPEVARGLERTAVSDVAGGSDCAGTAAVARGSDGAGVADAAGGIDATSGLEPIVGASTTTGVVEGGVVGAIGPADCRAGPDDSDPGLCIVHQSAPSARAIATAAETTSAMRRGRAARSVSVSAAVGDGPCVACAGGPFSVRGSGTCGDARCTVFAGAGARAAGRITMASGSHRQGRHPGCFRPPARSCRELRSTACVAPATRPGRIDRLRNRVL